jgi:hypothetical protein
MKELCILLLCLFAPFFVEAACPWQTPGLQKWSTGKIIVFVNCCIFCYSVDLRFNLHYFSISVDATKCGRFYRIKSKYIVGCSTSYSYIH